MGKQLRFKLLILLCLAMICGSQTALGQQPTQRQKDSLLNNWQQIPGTDIKIIPPAYFKPFIKDGKYGFMHEGAAASIAVLEVKGTPWVMVTQALTKEYIEKQGMKYIAREEVKTKAGKDGVIISVGFTVKSTDGKQDIPYERLMLFTGDYARTVWVQGNYPVVAKNVLYLVIRESLLSVQF
jgi:hypothetical protein